MARPVSYCAFEGCEYPCHGDGYCTNHYYQRKRGRPLKPTKRRKSAIGSLVVGSNGYMRMKTDSGWRHQHTVVMEEMLGRSLLPNEQVHHKNGIKTDNRPENLELWSKSQPSGQRVTDKVEWATEILRQYAPERLKDVQ